MNSRRGGMCRNTVGATPREAGPRGFIRQEKKDRDKEGKGEM